MKGGPGGRGVKFFFRDGEKLKGRGVKVKSSRGKGESEKFPGLETEKGESERFQGLAIGKGESEKFPGLESGKGEK